MRRQADKVLARIRKRLEKIDLEFHAVGRELAGLDRREVFEAFGVPTFRAFLEAHVMPASSAYRYITVAREYEPDLAKELGVTKAYALAQYASTAGLRDSPRVLAANDRRIGNHGRRVSELTVRELETMTRLATMQTARASIPKATRRETKAVRELTAQFEDRFGLDAKTRIDKKRGVLRIEVKLSDLLD